jgi:alkylhydroperoxidase family enzyme
MTDQSDTGRIPAGGFRELGPINWVLAKSAARTIRAPKMHLFATLGQHKRLFLSMMPYSALLLRGRLPQVDTELVILRVAHLRGSEYELQHHRWMRQQTLLRATDEFILNRAISPEVWQQLSQHLDKRQLIEFCMLAGQYDCLAATMSALQIPLDNPGQADRYK